MKGHGSVILERRFVPKGMLLMEEGEAANSAYLIQSGAVEVFTEHDGNKVVLAQLEPGQIFGEMALIFDEPRTASVAAIEDCNLIVITRQALKEKLANSDPTVKAIVTMLTQRMVSSNNTVVNKKSDIKDLTTTSRMIYQNILSSLPRARQKKFQDAVLPKLDAFLEAIDAFDD